MNTQTSRTIQIEHVTLDKRDHKTHYELATVRDVVLAELDNEACDPDNAIYSDDYDDALPVSAHNENGWTA